MGFDPKEAPPPMIRFSPEKQWFLCGTSPVHGSYMEDGLLIAE